MVKLKERFLEVINGDERLRPYLREYPCTPHRANVKIAFCDKYGREYKDGSLAFMFVSNSNITNYCGSKPDIPNYQDIFNEPYEASMRLAHNKKPSHE